MSVLWSHFEACKIKNTNAAYLASLGDTTIVTVALEF